MAEPIAPPPSGEPLTYKPLSGLALAGFAAAALFALLVLASTAVGLVKGVPFFFPPWTLLLAAAGAVLSLLAQGQIRNSEGTRAGLGLARAGLWLSVFAGLGYFAYYTVTGLALTSQADAFLREEGGFFPLLQKGAADPAALNAAFLLTLPANQRGSARPADEQAMRQLHDQPGPDGPGKLTKFKSNQLVRAFVAGGGAGVEPLGVQDWSYENRSYKVTRGYRVTTPDLVLEALVPALSTEGEQAGQARRWFVALPQVHKLSFKFTEQGERVNALRAEALRLLESPELVLRDFPKFDQTDWDGLRAEGLTAAALRATATRAVRGEGPVPPKFNLTPPDGIGGWERAPDGRLVFTQPFSLMVPLSEAVKSGLRLEGVARLQSRRPVDPGPAGGEAGGWEIAGLRFTRADVMDNKAAGPRP